MTIARVGANLKILRFIIGKAWFRGTALLPAVLTGLIPNIYFFTHAHTGTFGNVWGASRQSVQACKQCSTFARYESNGVLAFLHVSPPTLSPQLQRKYSNNPWNESIMSFRSPSSQSPASQFVSDFAGPPMANPHVRRLLHWAPSSAPQPPHSRSHADPLIWFVHRRPLLVLCTCRKSNVMAILSFKTASAAVQIWFHLVCRKGHGYELIWSIFSYDKQGLRPHFYFISAAACESCGLA